MQKIKTVLSIIIFLTSSALQAFQDPNNLFLVEVDNVYNPSQAGKPGPRPSVGDRALSAEEVLMYEVLQCRWEEGRWMRFTANQNAKGTIKVGHPFLQPGRNRIFFISNIPGGAGGYDIYYAEFKNNKWSEPTNVGLKVNTPSDEMFPFVTEAGILQIYRNSTQYNYPLSDVLGDAKILAEAVTKPATQMPTTQMPDDPFGKEKSKASVQMTPDPIEKKVQEPAEPFGKQTTSSEAKGLEYRVQLGSFSNPNWSLLNQFKPMGELKTIRTATGLTSVHVGAFSSLEAAQNLLKQVRQRPGFENAYVVGVEGDKVVSTHK
jgi:cell division septation protein DedD